MCRSLACVLALFALSIVARDAMSMEAICPGGAAQDPRVIWCDDFDRRTWLDLWAASPGFAPEYSEAVRCDGDAFGFGSPCAAYSGTLYFDNEWGYSNHYGVRGLGAQYAELYIRAYIRFSAPYLWGSVGDKGIYLEHEATAIANTKLEYSRWGTGKPAVTSYAIPYDLEQNQGNDLTFLLDRWYLVELYVKLNTPGVANGIVRWWVDDASVSIPSQTLRGEHTGLQIRTAGQTAGYNSVFLTDYNQRCDPPGCPPTRDQWVKWDNLVVSTGPIGPIDGTPPPTPPTGAIVLRFASWILGALWMVAGLMVIVASRAAWRLYVERRARDLGNPLEQHRKPRRPHRHSPTHQHEGQSVVSPAHASCLGADSAKDQAETSVLAISLTRAEHGGADQWRQ